MEEIGGAFDDFSIEMADYEVKKVDKFDRMWKVGEGGSAFQAPIIVDGILYFGSCNHNVYAVRKDTGELVWKFRTEAMITESSPVHTEGRIYLGSFDRNLYCINAKTGELIWKFHTQGEVYSSACLYEGRVYFGSRDRFLYCLDARTGDLIWKFETHDELVAPPVAHGGKILLAAMDRNMYCIDAGKGILIWKLLTQAELHAMGDLPVHDNVLYFGSFDNNLYAVDVRSGRVIWKFHTGVYGNGSAPVFHNDKIYHASRDGNVYCLNLDGKQLWKYTTRHNICAPIIYDEKLFFGSEDMNVHCLSLEGKPLWRKKFDGVVFIRPVAEDGVLYFTCWDCNTYALDIETREVKWKFRMDGSPSYLPPEYGIYEMEMKIKETDVEDTRRKDYGFSFREKEENTSAYKSEITYQMGTTYREKGKYQTDSEVEEF